MADDFQYPSRTLEEIERLAEAYRSFDGVVDADGRVSVEALLGALRVKLVVKSDKEMGEDRAYADPANNIVACRRLVSQGLRFGAPDARYVLLHEISHIGMHRGAEKKLRTMRGNRALSFIREEESAELQAWQMARALAVPRTMLSAVSDNEIALLVGIPVGAVELRRREVERAVAAS